MYELYLWWEAHRNDPVTWGLAVSFLFLIIDKLARNLITDQVRRLFHYKSEFSEYVANQQRIEAKIDVLMAERGLVWQSNGQLNGLKRMPPQPSRRLFLFLRKGISPGNQLRRKTMGKMNKGILVPIIAFALAKLQQYFNIAPLPEGTAEIAADILLGVITVVGLFMNAWKARGHKDIVEVRTGDTLSMGGTNDAEYIGDHGPAV